MAFANPKRSSSVEPFIADLTWAETARPLHISDSQPFDDMGQPPQEQRFTKGLPGVISGDGYS